MEIEKNIPSSLVQKIKDGKVVLFIGSGLSASVGYPNWKKLTIEILKKLEEKVEKSQKFIEALENEILDVMEVLKKLEKDQPSVIEAFEETFKLYKSIKPSISHSKLSSISNFIITTNYDNLIEQANPEIDKVVYNNKYKIAKLTTYEKYIFKIHGDFEDPSSCILLPNQYIKHYKEGNENSAIFTLKKTVSDYSFLFIGFSMTDPYISELFEYMEKMLTGFNPDNYIITTNELSSINYKLTQIKISKHEELHEIINYLANLKEDTQKIDFQLNAEIKVENLKRDVKGGFDVDDDFAPTVRNWVGRKNETTEIENHNFKVVFITGIGGQGKSTLASYFTNSNFVKQNFEFADWRDFKEEGNLFNSKLISILNRLDNSALTEIDSVLLSDAKFLVDKLFKLLQKRNVVFVFDNIDNYIDLEDFIPNEGMHYLVSQALILNHNSKFIFTCRPKINMIDVVLHQIHLKGITAEETFDFFKLYNVSTIKNLKEFCNRVHSYTNGHPLWINLIAGQAIRGQNAAENFINGLSSLTTFKEDNMNKIFTNNILSKVWESLNENQKLLLRCLAELVRAESTDNVFTILKREFNFNRFEKALKALKNLNLVVIKSSRSSTSSELIELHPMVKEFVISNHNKQERGRYISIIAKFYNKYIIILRPRLSTKLTLSEFNNWTCKIELDINNLSFHSAYTNLIEIEQYIVSSGYTEEYLRVLDKFFDALDISTIFEGNKYLGIHDLINSYALYLCRFNQFQKAQNFLNDYKQFIVSPNSYLINYYSIFCHMSWLKGNYEEAINYGEIGEKFLNSSDQSDTYQLRNNLALARRDSRKSENINKALNYFLQGQELSFFLQNSNLKTDKSAIWGNIGRCLELLDDKNNALFCYCKSFELLCLEQHSLVRINLGYAAFWIFGIIKSYGKDLDSICFLHCSMNQWINSAPILYKEAKELMDSFDLNLNSVKEIIESEPIYILEECKKWVEGYLNPNLGN